MLHYLVYTEALTWVAVPNRADAKAPNIAMQLGLVSDTSPKTTKFFQGVTLSSYSYGIKGEKIGVSAAEICQ